MNGKLSRSTLTISSLDNVEARIYPRLHSIRVFRNLEDYFQCCQRTFIVASALDPHAVQCVIRMWEMRHFET